MDAYFSFLRYASEWLSHINVLVSAIALMIISCFSLAGIISWLFKGKSQSQVEHHVYLDLDKHWHLDEVFILMAIFLYVASQTLILKKSSVYGFHPYCSCCWGNSTKLSIKVGLSGFIILIFQRY